MTSDNEISTVTEHKSDMPIVTKRNKRGTNPNSLKALQEHGNKNGQRNADAVRFARELRTMIVERGESVGEDGRTRIDALIERVWTDAIAGKEWAVNFLADRVEGKVTQQIDATVSGVIASDDLSKLTAHERGAMIETYLARRAVPNDIAAQEKAASVEAGLGVLTSDE